MNFDPAIMVHYATIALGIFTVALIPAGIFTVSLVVLVFRYIDGIFDDGI